MNTIMRSMKTWNSISPWKVRSLYLRALNSSPQHLSDMNLRFVFVFRKDFLFLFELGFGLTFFSAVVPQHLSSINPNLQLQFDLNLFLCRATVTNSTCAIVNLLSILVSFVIVFSFKICVCSCNCIFIQNTCL